MFFHGGGAPGLYIIFSVLAKFLSFIPNIFALLNKQAVQSVMCEESTSYAIETTHFMFIVIGGLQDRNFFGRGENNFTLYATQNSGISLAEDEIS